MKNYGNLGDFEGNIILKANGERRKEEVGRQLPTILEEVAANSPETRGGRRLRTVLGVTGGQSNLSGKRKRTLTKRCYGTLNLGAA